MADEVSGWGAADEIDTAGMWSHCRLHWSTQVIQPGEAVMAKSCRVVSNLIRSPWRAKHRAKDPVTLVKQRQRKVACFHFPLINKIRRRRGHVEQTGEYIIRQEKTMHG